MIIVAFIVFGGATTLTMDRGIGVIGLCIVGLAAIVGCLMAWDELRR